MVSDSPDRKNVYPASVWPAPWEGLWSAALAAQRKGLEIKFTWFNLRSGEKRGSLSRHVAAVPVPKACLVREGA